MVRAYPRVSDSVYFRWDQYFSFSARMWMMPVLFPLRTRDCTAVVPRSPGLSQSIAVQVDSAAELGQGEVRCGQASFPVSFLER